MRRISKHDVPEVLVENAETWTEELLAKRSGDKDVAEAAETRYRHKQIRDVVKAEAHGKCVYCESKITHAQPGDVEHIRPKSLHPELAFDWRNLILSCRVCNTKKGVYDDEKKPLVNPTEENPDDFFRAFGPLLEAIDEEGRGFLTETHCDLNRGDLIQWRCQVIQKLRPIVELWRGSTDPALKEAWRRKLIDAISPAAEYTLVAKSYMLFHGVPIEEELGE